MGPVTSAALGQLVPDFATALNYALASAAAGLILSATYLRYEARRKYLLKDLYHG